MLRWFGVICMLGGFLQALQPNQASAGLTTFVVGLGLWLFGHVRYGIRHEEYRSAVAGELIERFIREQLPQSWQLRLEEAAFLHEIDPRTQVIHRLTGTRGSATPAEPDFSPPLPPPPPRSRSALPRPQPEPPVEPLWLRVVNEGDKAADALRPRVESGMTATYGPDWLNDVNRRRVERRMPRFDSLADPRAVLWIFANDRAFKRHTRERKLADGLLQLVHAANHRHALGAADLELAKHLVEALSR